MKTNYCAIGAGVLLASALAATAVPVTFRVNMQYQIDNFTFAPDTDTAEVRGDSGIGWGPGLALTNAGSGIYQNTLDITAAAGSTVQFKFWKSAGTDTWEPIQGYIYPPTGNRTFILGTTATNLPVVYFGDKWAGTTPVLFRVNMAAQVDAGNFVPGSDTVEVKGSMNGWGGGFAMTNDPLSTNIYIYSTVVDVADPAPNGQAAMKFHIYGTHDIWEDNPNRIILVTAPSTTLPVECFNRICQAPIIKAAVFYQVDMNAFMLANMDTNTDEVWLRGNVVGWGQPPQGLQMFNDIARPGVFTNTWSKTNQLVGDPIFSKYTVWYPGTFATAWDNDPDKKVVFTGTEPMNSDGYHQITMPLESFRNLKVTDLLPADTLVTFQVSTTNANLVDKDTGIVIRPFDPLFDTVFVNGTPWNWWAWGASPPAANQLTNDYPAQVYSGTFLFAKGSPIRLEYKYSASGPDNENAAGKNHIRFIRSTGSYTLPLDQFGNALVESEFGALTVKRGPGAGQVTIGWSGLPGGTLLSAPTLTGPWTEVPGTLGASSATVNATGAAKFFRAYKP